MTGQTCYECGASVEPDDDFPIPEECPHCGGTQFVAEVEIASVERTDRTVLDGDRDDLGTVYECQGCGVKTIQPEECEQCGSDDLTPLEA